MPSWQLRLIPGLALVVTTIMLASAHAEIRILASPGGQVGPFLDLFDKVRATGERVVIDGPCLSACTLVLSTIPQDRICVTPRAVLGFHAARWIDQQGQQYAASASASFHLYESSHLCAAVSPMWFSNGSCCGKRFEL